MRLGVVFLVIVLSGTMAMTTLAKPKRDRQKPTGTSKERTTATGSKMSETQQQNINKLKADLNSIKQGSQVTQAQKDALKNSLTAIVDGATKPDPALVQQLANDLTQAMADSNLTTKEKIQLATDLQKVMNSANIPQEEVTQAIADIQAIFVASGVSQADVQKVVKDLQAIAAEAQKNAQNSSDKVNIKTQGREQKRVKRKK